MQLRGIPQSLGARVNGFRLRPEYDWEPDWEEFERAVNPRTRLVYVSNPNNPTGAVLSEEAMRRMAARCDEMGAWLLADEVYQGAEIAGPRTPSFWGLGERVVVTSGLSKAYGIPGVRIGWIVGPPDLVAECWAQHDYLTIGPNKISDAVALVAVRPENREKLYARTRAILRENAAIMRRVGGELSTGSSASGRRAPARSAWCATAPPPPAASWRSGSASTRACSSCPARSLGWKAFCASGSVERRSSCGRGCGASPSNSPRNGPGGGRTAVIIGLLHGTVSHRAARVVAFPLGHLHPAVAGHRDRLRRPRRAGLPGKDARDRSSAGTGSSTAT